MNVQRLSSTNGFIVQDLDAATVSAGPVRLAPKVLRDGAVLLARSATYAFASFGIEGHGGASAAVNATPEERDAALAAFVDEVRAPAEAGSLRLWPGLGVTNLDLEPLGWDDPDPILQAAGALAAARAVLGAAGSGDLAGQKVTVVGAGPVVDAALEASKESGASLTDVHYGAETDVLFVEGKAGCLDHTTAESVKARVVVPLSPVPVTARALAILGRAECIVVPDFLSTAAPLLAAYDTGDADPVERISGAVGELTGKGTGLWLAAAERAEENLAGWTDERPFGRPLA